MLSRQDDAFFPRWYLCTIEQRELLSLQSQISGKLFVVIQLLLEDRCQWLPRAVRTKPHPYSTTKIRPRVQVLLKKSLAFSKGFLIRFSKEKHAHHNSDGQTKRQDIFIDFGDHKRSLLLSQV